MLVMVYITQEMWDVAQVSTSFRAYKERDKHSGTAFSCVHEDLHNYLAISYTLR